MLKLLFWLTSNKYYYLPYKKFPNSREYTPIEAYSHSHRQKAYVLVHTLALLPVNITIYLIK